ncbi:hypothetical protein ACWDOR_45425 [Streptosporangium canum]|uniref:hypothetical protein n=1 Tax=Streptosporangium canum TaxID=324952 RepID=UPI0037BC5CC1
MSRLRQLLPGSRTAIDVPFDHIEAAWKDDATMRVSYTWVVGGHRRDVVTHAQGVVDIAGDLETYEALSEDGCVTVFRVGSQFYHLLSDEERQRTGKRWQWVEDDLWKWEYTPEIWSIARLKAFAVETLGGKELRRYTLVVKPRHGEKEPVLAELHHALHRLGTDRFTLDIWMTEDGDVRRTRRHLAMFRTRRGIGELTSVTIEYWDPGVPDRLIAPCSKEIVPPPAQV